MVCNFKGFDVDPLSPMTDTMLHKCDIIPTRNLEVYYCREHRTENIEWFKRTRLLE